MTDVFYCHHCGAGRGFFSIGLPAPTTLTGTAYQLGKYVKHITLPSGTDLHSMFKDKSYASYENWTIHTMASGCVHVDDHGHTLEFYVGPGYGVTYSGGIYYAEAEIHRVVYPYDLGRNHSYPVPAGKYPASKCVDCGNDVFILV